MRILILIILLTFIGCSVESQLVYEFDKDRLHEIAVEKSEIELDRGSDEVIITEYERYYVVESLYYDFKEIVYIIEYEDRDYDRVSILIEESNPYCYLNCSDYEYRDREYIYLYD